MSQATYQTDAQTPLEVAHSQLVLAVRELVSGEDWQRMLDVSRRFRNYSPTNCLLILSQCPDATRVAGYKAWQAMRRQVRRGERAIRIYAPIVVRSDEKAEDSANARRVVGFRLASVFDVSQTEGEPLPDVSPELLEGEAPADLWYRLASQVRERGFSLERGACGAANGWTDHVSRRVRVRADVSDVQACKTLAHELAHVVLHREDVPCRGVVEVEAESVAYQVVRSCGVTSDAYTFPYVAGWADGDVDVVQQTAERVITTARTITDAMQRTSAA